MRIMDRTTALLLIGLFVWADAPAHAARSPRNRAIEPVKQQNYEETIQLSEKERRTNPELAKAEVLEKAQKHVAHWLMQVKPNTRWEPSLAYLQRLGVIGKPEAGGPEQVAELNESLYSASVKVEISPDAQTVLLREARLAEAWDRQTGLLKLFVGMLACVGAFAAYYWLDDVTKGYYTNWLRAGLVAGLLAAVGFAFVATGSPTLWSFSPTPGKSVPVEPAVFNSDANRSEPKPSPDQP